MSLVHNLISIQVWGLCRLFLHRSFHNLLTDRRETAPHFLFLLVAIRSWVAVCKMKFKFIVFLIAAICTCEQMSAQIVDTCHYRAPFQLHIMTNRAPKGSRFRDIKGRFHRVRVEFTNTDIVEHVLDYSCFCLVDNKGIEYEVHFDATRIKESEREDLAIFDSEYVGFLNEVILKPNFSVRGWLLFAVPKKDNYKLKFRGYKHINLH